jgi:CRISPR-associated endonuclease/helicase Cas3
MTELWAKSLTNDGRQLTLLQHTVDVIDAAEWLFVKPGSPNRLGSEWLRFFRLDPAVFDLFARTLRAAAGFHDLGKANDGFQDAVKRTGEQAIRHEHLSTLLMFESHCWKWLKEQSGVDWEVALSAVFTHHLQAPMTEPIRSRSTSRKDVQLVVGAQFETLTVTIQDRLKLSGEWPKLPEFWTFERSGPGEVIPSRTKALTEALEEFDQDLDSDDQRKRLLWAVRAGLIAADAAASGLFREAKVMPKWIAERFETLESCDACYVQREIISKRIQQLGSSWKGWHQFQDGAAVQPSHTLLLAPCGAGKTLAAWRWIKEQTRHRPVKRLIFLYPTRATATEGFKDYVAWAPEADASLIHGTASYELEGMFKNPLDPEDVRKGKSFTRNVDPRLFALSFWGKRVFAGTVDQFLAFLQFAYGPMCLLPVLADSVVVIDEVHSFDDKMFSALKAFLTKFDVPVLCMTATLPDMRRRELRQCGLAEYADKPDDLQKIADADRYAIRRLSSRKGAEERAVEAFRQHRRVLWVVNKVRVAQELARRFGTVETPQGLRNADGVLVLCYHSRFTLDDRKHWHGLVVSSFKRKKGEAPWPILAVATQVCEMSLDLDADVLITEMAPITALIQRMGRCNRKNEEPKTVGDVFVYPPDGPQPDAPYKPEDLTGVPDFLSEIATGKPVGQSALETALRNHGRKPPQGDRLVQFVISGPYADGDEEEFRDIDDVARRGILDEAQYLRTASVRRPGLIVPVPKKHEDHRGTARETRHLVIAKSGYYHQALGLCDERIGV